MLLPLQKVSRSESLKVLQGLLMLSRLSSFMALRCVSISNVTASSMHVCSVLVPPVCSQLDADRHSLHVMMKSQIQAQKAGLTCSLLILTTPIDKKIAHV